MLSPVVVGLFWKFMLDVQFGVVNSFLDSLGLGRVEWLTQAAGAVTDHRRHLAVDAVHHADRARGPDGGAQVPLRGGEIDRASEWFKFRRITFPLVWPLLLIAVMFRAIEAFRLFDLVYILTGGGPGGTTETLSYNVYKVAFFGFDTGRAAAYGILMVIVVILAAQLYLRYLDRLRSASDGSSHWQGDEVIAGETARRPSAAAGLGSGFEIVLLALLAVVMLFPVVWMLETALKETRTSTRCRPRCSTSADARPHQGRLQLELAGVLGLQELGDRGHGVDDHRHGARRAAAWAYSRFQIRPRRTSFFILSTRFMPPVVVVIPVFLMFRDLGCSTRCRA